MPDYFSWFQNGMINKKWTQRKGGCPGACAGDSELPQGRSVAPLQWFLELLIVAGGDGDIEVTASSRDDEDNLIDTSGTTRSGSCFSLPWGQEEVLAFLLKSKHGLTS